MQLRPGFSAWAEILLRFLTFREDFPAPPRPHLRPQHPRRSFFLQSRLRQFRTKTAINRGGGPYFISMG